MEKNLTHSFDWVYVVLSASVFAILGIGGVFSFSEMAAAATSPSQNTLMRAAAIWLGASCVIIVVYLLVFLAARISIDKNTVTLKILWLRLRSVPQRMNGSVFFIGGFPALVQVGGQALLPEPILRNLHAVSVGTNNSVRRRILWVAAVWVTPIFLVIVGLVVSG